jgi:hypothetical protein
MAQFLQNVTDLVKIHHFTLFVNNESDIWLVSLQSQLFNSENSRDLSHPKPKIIKCLSTCTFGRPFVTFLKS